jgi:polyhydroxybutyrate depolymerase
MNFIKIALYSIFLTFFCGCAGTPSQSSDRAPAGSKLESQGIGAFFGFGAKYQGPFEISPANFNRPSKVFIPNNYDNKDKWPLILLLHGYTSNANEADTLLGLSKRVTSRGFILLTPEGTKLPYTDAQHSLKKGDAFWNATDFCCDFEKTGVDDVSYLLGLIKEAAARYHVDPERIYLFGHSNGGFMLNRLLCETDGVFAGAVSLAGSTYKDPKLCRLLNPVSYLQVHAEDDPSVAYGENPEHAGGYETVLRRVGASACTGEPLVGAQEDYVLSIPGRDTTPITWNTCQAETEVALWKLKPYSSMFHAPHHPWFHNIAGERAIDFLFKHTLPKRQ